LAIADLLAIADPVYRGTFRLQRPLVIADLGHSGPSPFNIPERLVREKDYAGKRVANQPDQTKGYVDDEGVVRCR